MRNKLLMTAVMMACAAGAANAADDEKTTVGGRAFIDFTNIDQSLDGADTAANGTGIDVKRFYLIVDHKFDDMWSANLTTDFNYVANDAETQIYVKKAYLQAKISDAFIARAGSSDLPWVPFVEGIYGYRYVENVVVDRLKFGTSADWGLHASGSFANSAVAYAVSVIEGGGYKNPTRSNSMDVEGRLSFMPIKGLTFAAGFYNGKLGKDVANAVTHHSAERLDVLAAYVTSDFRVGAEYFEAKNWTQVTAVPSDKATGYSVWGSFNFNEQFSIFARYDDSDPKKDLASDLSNQYYNLGLAYKPRKNIDLALVYKYDEFKDVPTATAISDSNISVPSTVGGVGSGKHSEIGVWMQVGF
jgi:hypothetical protein